LARSRQLNAKPLGRPKVRETRYMPLPLQIGIVAAVRRVVGATVRLRHAWQGDNSTVYAVLDDEKIVAYLKLAAGVQAERERLDWLEPRLPVPQVLASGVVDSSEWLLLTPCRGLDLANLKHTEPASRIVALLAQALRIVHNTAAADCPFGIQAPGSRLVHGDACLPNFLFADGVLTGVLDVADCGLGDPRSDLVTAVWSVQYNLGPGHAAAFLNAYDIDLAANDLELGFDADGTECVRLVGERTRM
jgi:aminoglycoside phosphotransferase